MILVGKVHGRTEVIKMINDVPHYPEAGKKGKVNWQATCVCPNRMSTFEEQDITDEEALAMQGKRDI